MQLVKIDSLSHMNLHFRDPEVFAESWIKRRSFALYKNTPRPSSAFFFICTDITASFIHDSGSTVTARRGDVVYIPEGTTYHVRISGAALGKTDTYTVNFRLFSEEGEPLSLSERISVLARVEDNALELRAASLGRAVRQIDGTAGETRNFLKINAAFYSLLDAIATAATEHSDPYYPIRIGAEALRAEWNKNEKIEKYAALCGISNAYFYRCFREWSGKSPVEYRNLLRLSHAEAMLRYTDMRVSEISDFIGFDDPFYFCRIFSRQFGSSPQKYRKAFREKD
jgi:AraC-like DNA-binding protein